MLFTSMFRFTNLTDLNLTKNEISYIEDGAFAGQANLQVCIPGTLSLCCLFGPDVESFAPSSRLRFFSWVTIR